MERRHHREAIIMVSTSLWVRKISFECCNIDSTKKGHLRQETMMVFSFVSPRHFLLLSSLLGIVVRHVTATGLCALLCSVTTTINKDVVIIGAGMAGASIFRFLLVDERMQLEQSEPYCLASNTA
jgi:hypothetical protein